MSSTLTAAQTTTASADSTTLADSTAHDATQPIRPAVGRAAELARAVRITCSMVADAPDVEEVTLGEHGVAAGAQRRVDQHCPAAVGGPAGQRRSEQFGAAVQQYRQMRSALSHYRTPIRLGFWPGGRCTEVPVRVRGPGVGEVRQGRFGQRPRCTGLQVKGCCRALHRLPRRSSLREFLGSSARPRHPRFRGNPPHRSRRTPWSGSRSDGDRRTA